MRPRIGGIALYRIQKIICEKSLQLNNAKIINNKSKNYTLEEEAVTPRSPSSIKNPPPEFLHEKFK